MKISQSCVETSTRKEVKGLPRKPAHRVEDAPETQDGSKYVDLELVHATERGTNVEEEPLPGQRNQMSVLINSVGAGVPRVTEPSLEPPSETDTDKNVTVGPRDGKRVQDVPLSSAAPRVDETLGDRPEPGDNNSGRVFTHREVTTEGENENPAGETEEEPCGDGYLSRGSESDDFEEDSDVSLVLFGECVPCVTEDESHYITTHEIQLSELSDHEGDYDLGVGSSASWEIEDDNQVYSFVDYAFDGSGAGRGGGERREAAVSTLGESDPCDAAKFTSSDESASKSLQQQHKQQQQQQQQPPCAGNGGQIHLSIRTTSRAINDPSNIQEKENILYHARRSGDVSRYVFRGVDGTGGTLCDRAECFIAAPGRVHFGGKLRGKEVTEYSSGTSSAVSDLDDADKEVRNLTARAFKSLAHPYLDSINFSTSSESSASEHGVGINRWSTFVDLKYGNVNMSRGLDQRVVSHQNSTASFEIAKNIDNRLGYKGVKAPSSKIFTLKADPRGASTSTQKIELMGKFGQGHSGVITLTETLNFRCNVQSGMSGNAPERPPNFAQNAAGSRSTYEVTKTLPSGQRRGASQPPSKTMEDTHKKAIFASSVIKNVISKKMQFEQERKMERGEISETLQAPSPCVAAQQDGDGHRGRGSRELHRQSSRFSEAGSEHTIACVDELGDIVDGGSCDAKSDSRRRGSVAPETNLESANELGIDTKKGALEASKSTLLRSQNSAFRCWKDEELEFQKGRKNDRTAEEKPPSANDKDADRCAAARGSKLTKMSHLFVPSIQLLCADGEAAQPAPSGRYSPCEDEGDAKRRSGNTLYIADPGSTGASKSPEIKINLRSVRDNKTEPFSVSKLRAPNIGCNAVRAEEFKSQALAAALKGECSDKVPHFMVRDIRDSNNKGKLQTPIHQVRDVRKLVKSSYHFVSLDNNEHKPNASATDGLPEPKKQTPNRNPTSVSPIVIKCQSVNTNSNGKQPENLQDTDKGEVLEADRSTPPEGAKGVQVQKAAARAPTGNAFSSDGGNGLKSESRLASRRASDITDKKAEPKMANQVAFEKLQAAVKTMEQLYVFEKNEWKRKNEPHPMTDSHVLSLITSEEHGGAEEERGASNLDKTLKREAEKTPPAGARSPNTDKDHARVFQSLSSHDEKFTVRSLDAAGEAGSRNISSSLRTSANTPAKTPPSISGTAPFHPKVFTPKSPKLPVSLKIRPTKVSGYDGFEPKDEERSTQEVSSTPADHENYLTIPVKAPQTSKPVSTTDKTSVYTFPNAAGPGTRAQEDRYQSPKRSSIVMETRSPETPSAAIYHTVPLATSHPQVYCFSPAMTPAPSLDPFQTTQRKMLLDPTTGNYYLVDTPVQPSTKRLFDPETGQYVDVPMPQPPMTPVPMQVSPLALSPGAYGHTYMIYPSFMPTPSVIPARTLVQSQMSMQSDAENGEKVSSQHPEGRYMESPFYMTTGKSPQATAATPQQLPVAGRTPQGFSSTKQPLISITTQQGPRIIAPPSFDGTTMSFVVEHR